MIKFMTTPTCPKCGCQGFDWSFYSKGPMYDSANDGPSEFIKLGCSRCRYGFDMYPKDYKEEEQ